MNQNKRLLLWKKLKKSRFRDFRSKKIVSFHRSQLNFWKTWKWLYYLQLRMFIDKVKNFCDHSMILWKMAANRKHIGSFWIPPPASFRVNIVEHSIMYTLQTVDIRNISLPNFKNLTQCLLHPLLTLRPSALEPCHI